MAEYVGCGKYMDMISFYADGELSGQDKAELEKHLEQCASCRALLSAYQSIDEAAAESMAEPPVDFKESVMNTIRMLPNAGGQPANRRKRKLKPVVISFAAAAACLALAFIAVPRIFNNGANTSTGMTMSAPVNDAAAMPSASAGDNKIYSAESKASGTEAADGAARTSVFKPKEQSDLAAASGGQTSEAISSPAVPSAALTSTPPVKESPAASANETASPSEAGPQSLWASRDDHSGELNDYYAVFDLNEPLPAILQDLNKTKADDGTTRIDIPIETAKTLIDDGYTAVMGNKDATKALVIVSGT